MDFGAISLKSNILDSIRRVVAIVEEELLAHFNGSIGKDSDAMVTIHPDYFGLTIRV